jgi:hypothetical protein
MDIDVVAEAIWRAEGFPFAPHSWDITDPVRDRYRRMAAAAIDALGLTPEFYRPWQAAKLSRLVSPWVRDETSPLQNVPDDA